MHHSVVRSILVLSIRFFSLKALSRVRVRARDARNHAFFHTRTLTDYAHRPRSAVASVRHSATPYIREDAHDTVSIVFNSMPASTFTAALGAASGIGCAAFANGLRRMHAFAGAYAISDASFASLRRCRRRTRVFWSNPKRRVIARGDRARCSVCVCREYVTNDVCCVCMV